MALSRLRHPVIRRAPSLIRARFLSFSSTHPSLIRTRGLNSCTDVAESLLRPAPFSLVNGIHDDSSKIKFQIGVRCYSSAELPEHTVVQMPALSPTMSQGNIAKWRKKEGDKIEVGDVICEIETDKATLEFECLEEGFLAKILVPEGSKDVPVGQPIAITVMCPRLLMLFSLFYLSLSRLIQMLLYHCQACADEDAFRTIVFQHYTSAVTLFCLVEDADDIANIPTTVSGSEVIDKTSSEQTVAHGDRNQESSSVNISTSELPPHIVLDMPALSPTMIEVGDVICEIETDKATLEFESLEEGFLAKILAPEGSKEVAVGQPIAITVEDPNDLEAVKASSIGNLSDKDEKPVEQSTAKDVKTQKTGFNRISPAAKLLILEHGLDASSITASGPRGTLLKGDVLTAIKSGKGSSSVSGSKERISSSPPTHPQTSSSMPVGSKSTVQDTDAYEDLPNSQIRKHMEKLSRILSGGQRNVFISLRNIVNIRHTDVILDPLLSFRKELKAKYDVKVSVNDIVIKAVAIALRNVPEANAYWDTSKDEIVLCDSVDISIAVATEKGLMTPIVRNADQKSISSISLEVKELAEKARAGKLKPHEFQGGTFSISNLGMYPVDRFCAIINPPQLATPGAKIFMMWGGSLPELGFYFLVTSLLLKLACTVLGKFMLTIYALGCTVDFNYVSDNLAISFLKAGILAVGRGNQVVEPVIGDDGIEKPAVVTKMNLTLSADHRVFDGKVGGSFVAALQSNFRDIQRLLL
ncbi:hypothetical protein DH2020_030143 [Rehmannia glutinosa]|uniref:Dihydrolipoamide acetyltransferase component of pyruvate dehydrogenase complex n=1 Tax=Rehmannia glutinosa TaxID=99300 RepID=A0ABR0VLN1_REHGL